MTVHRIRTLLLLAAMTGFPLLAPRDTAAQVVVSNGTPDGDATDFRVFGSMLMADDFVLDAPMNMTGFQWYALRSRGLPDVVTSSFAFLLLKDEAGKPSYSVSGGSISFATGSKTNYDCCDGEQDMDIFLYDIPISMVNHTGFTRLEAGTYWLAIGAFFDEFRTFNHFAGWAPSHATSGNGLWSPSTAHEVGDNYYDHLSPVVDQARPISAELAFSIYGTTAAPEPASLTLLATGLLGTFAVMRRRRKPSLAARVSSSGCRAGNNVA